MKTLNRQGLAARQHQVLSDLLTGTHPAGFDARAVAATAGVLHRKRWRRVRTALPRLTRLPEAAATFQVFARQHSASGCGHSDARAFLTWWATDSAPARAELRRLAVVDGDRALAWLPHDRCLVIGLGRRYWEIPFAHVEEAN